MFSYLAQLAYCLTNIIFFRFYIVYIVTFALLYVFFNMTIPNLRAIIVNIQSCNKIFIYLKLSHLWNIILAIFFIPTPIKLCHQAHPNFFLVLLGANHSSSSNICSNNYVSKECDGAERLKCRVSFKGRAKGLFKGAFWNLILDKILV